jgi:hypothetical protein
MRRYDPRTTKQLSRLSNLLRKALANATHSPHAGHAQRIGTLAGKIFRVREERLEMAHAPSPRLEAIRDRIARGDVSNADNDRFWLMKYVERHVLIPKTVFDPAAHKHVRYVLP